MAWASFELLTLADEELALEEPTEPVVLVAVLALVVCEAALGIEAAGSAAEAGTVAAGAPWVRWRGGIVNCVCMEFVVGCGGW